MLVEARPPRPRRGSAAAPGRAASEAPAPAFPAPGLRGRRGAARAAAGLLSSVPLAGQAGAHPARHPRPQGGGPASGAPLDLGESPLLLVPTVENRIVAHDAGHLRETVVPAHQVIAALLAISSRRADHEASHKLLASCGEGQRGEIVTCHVGAGPQVRQQCAAHPSVHVRCARDLHGLVDKNSAHLGFLDVDVSGAIVHLEDCSKEREVREDQREGEACLALPLVVEDHADEIALVDAHLPHILVDDHLRVLHEAACLGASRRVGEALFGRQVLLELEPAARGGVER
mmetsp:Transcript_124512/g.346639  ORF Transcript_124512/g.346639 Transcript_124512/m.346639 type:complete len:288 (+) Transcript_124512:2184-3047(+)